MFIPRIYAKFVKCCLNFTDENTDSSLNTEKAGDDIVSDVQPVIDNSETITETSAETSVKPRNILSFPVTSTEQTPLLSTSNESQKSKSQNRLHEAFSPKRLRPAITSSEKTRNYCAFIAALLVLLSYAGFPILSSDVMKNIILFRPLFLLIVTNITIVVAPFLLEKVKQKEQRRSSTSDAGFANQIGTILEWGMLMKTGLSALFMDCSIYSVVVVCGMSFLLNFGW